MTLITPALRGHLRSMTARFLTDTCTIEARSNSVGEFGDPQEVFASVAAGVACRVITLGTRYAVAALNPAVLGREALVDAYRLVVPAGTALDVDHRVTMSSGEVYQVVDLITERTDETDEQAIIVRVR
jgi:hypothetical protein